MIRRIVFIESSDEIDLLEDLFNEDSIVVSINSSVSKDLKKKSISTRTKTRKSIVTKILDFTFLLIIERDQAINQ